MARKHKYVLTIEFESERPVVKHENALVQFENALGYFVERPINVNASDDDNINNTFIYGTGKTKLKKVSK